MVLHKIYDAEVDIQIPADVFPTKEELAEREEAMPEGGHGWFESSYEKAKLHYRYWLPKGEPKGISIFMHGISSHSGKGMVIDGRNLSTSLLIESYLEQDIALYCFDQYGHGFSEGYRFWIPESWENNKRDSITFCNLVANKHSDKIPLFLTGESYGGNLTIHVAKHFQEHPDEGPSNFDSIVLTAPAIIGDLPPFPVYQILRYCLAPLFPKWVPSFMPNLVSPERIWRDEEVLKRKTSARFKEMLIDGGGRPFRLGTAVNLVLALEEVRNVAIPGLKIPFCIVHGTEDACVPITGSEFMMNTAATPDDQKELHRIEGAFHDLLSDPMAEKSMSHVIKFIQKRMQKSS
jgi:acylglycerol lipase